MSSIVLVLASKDSDQVSRVSRLFERPTAAQPKPGQARNINKMGHNDTINTSTL